MKDLIEKFEQYWDDTMPESEVDAFEGILLNDKTIKEQFETWLAIQQAGTQIRKSANRADEQRKVTIAQQQTDAQDTSVVRLPQKTSAKIFSFNRVLAIAASFFGIFIMFHYQEDIRMFFASSENIAVTAPESQNPIDTVKKEIVPDMDNPNTGSVEAPKQDNKKALPKTTDKQITNEQIAYAQNNYPKLDKELNSQTLGSSSEDKLKAVKISYENGNYAEVILQLEGKVSEKNELQLLAEAHFREKNYDKAEEILKKSTINKYDDTEWRLLMVYLVQSPNKNKEFNELLKKIKGDKKHKYNDKANKLKIND